MPRAKAIICDLDGTLALIEHRNPYDASTSEQDELNTPVAEILKRFAPEYKIILVSGRMDTWRPETERWLATHRIPYDELYMRQPGDFRKDTVVKGERWTRELEDRFDVLFVLDDRNQAVEQWRALGLTCMQVAPGNF